MNQAIFEQTERDREFIFAMNAAYERAWRVPSRLKPEYFIGGLDGLSASSVRYMPMHLWDLLRPEIGDPTNHSMVFRDEYRKEDRDIEAWERMI